MLKHQYNIGDILLLEDIFFKKKFYGMICKKDYVHSRVYKMQYLIFCLNKVYINDFTWRPLNDFGFNVIKKIV